MGKKGLTIKEAKILDILAEARNRFFEINAVFTDSGSTEDFDKAITECQQLILSKYLKRDYPIVEVFPYYLS